ncbi:MAG: DegT/DnrJ/EryC1/StrS aminotransferase family protein [Magnetococcales bacterium]|nr:DegT/DnrJ/EryC1/StrS aminotransferase family protein [Magnetococcales bacterium]
MPVKQIQTNHLLLYRPDLTSSDEKTVLTQLVKKNFRDEAALIHWEEGLATLWERPALAFAEHAEAIAALKNILGWRSGETVGVDPLLEPAWREALQEAWLHQVERDVDPATGQGTGTWRLPPDMTQPRAAIVRHAFGLPSTMMKGHAFVLEEISSMVRPMSGCGEGDVQLLDCSGPRILAIGAGCALLARDAGLIRELARVRRHPPGGAACALGCSLLTGLPERLERRQELAMRYLTMRLAPVACHPANPASGRAWEQFCLRLHDGHARQGMEGFLQKVGIGCGSPVWFQPPGEHPPGLRRFLEQTLALPLYASLSDAACKRVINRVHRWMERTP